jgi:hypothetical protein
VLENDILGKFWESHKSGTHNKSTKEKHAQKNVSAFSGANNWKEEYS